MDSKRILANFI
jgi:hypothetical protein